MKHNLAHFVIHIYGLEIFYTTISKTNKDVGFKLQNQEKTDGLLMQNGLQLERACPILGPMIPRCISFNLSTSISISMHVSLISFSVTKKSNKIPYVPVVNYVTVSQPYQNSFDAASSKLSTIFAYIQCTSPPSVWILVLVSDAVSHFAPTLKFLRNKRPNIFIVSKISPASDSFPTYS